MDTFYTNIESLNAFTLSLDCLDEKAQCTHCSKVGQLVSHGFVYKQLSSSKRKAVGKRLFCSNRYGRSGCGRTLQLYVTHCFPFLRYGAAELFVFLSSLILGWAVTHAYQTATGREETRHAWRWLDRLEGKLLDFRRRLEFTCKNKRLGCSSPCSHRSRRLQLLLPTLVLLFSNAEGNPCSRFQLTHQIPFIWSAYFIDCSYFPHRFFSVFPQSLCDFPHLSL